MDNPTPDPTDILTEAEEIADVEAALEMAPAGEINAHPSFSSLSEDIDSSHWPKVRLRRLRIQNFGPDHDMEIEFGDHILHCLVGPNGIGKTTILYAIQMLFANFTGYHHKLRYLPNMLRHIRNFNGMTPEQQAAADFSVLGRFEILEPGGSPRTYDIELRRQVVGGFLGAHPGVVRMNLPHYCFMARFDQELHNFQVRRTKWTLFAELFKAVTGYAIEEDVPMLDGIPLSQSADLRTQRAYRDYVQGFRVFKQRETISHKQCSAGERKIAKSFSTILNKPVQPNIILIDNITDHVELARHLPVMAAVDRCFETSQIIVTCHSQPVQRNLPNRDRLIDLRFLHCPALARKQPWRMRLYDSVADSLDRIHSTPSSEFRQRAESNARNLMRWLVDEPRGDYDQPTLVGWVQRHLSDVDNMCLRDVAENTPLPRIRLVN